MRFSKTNKEAQIGDIWLMEFKYKEKGNYFKVRPALISDINEEKEKLVVRMITTNNNNGILIEDYKNKNLKEKSYLSKRYEVITYDKLIRRIWSKYDIK